MDNYGKISAEHENFLTDLLFSFYITIKARDFVKEQLKTYIFD
ncbi:hypothetical protein [Clostridium argentinense]|nr:hypothetical protein [Clostridium argentinense]